MYSTAIKVRKARLEEMKEQIAAGVFDTDQSMSNAVANCEAIQEQITMLEDAARENTSIFQRSLIQYLLALKLNGFTRLHVTDVIPSAKWKVNGNKLSQTWNQFPKIDQSLLDEAEIKYEQGSGWFTL